MIRAILVALTVAALTVSAARSGWLWLVDLPSEQQARAILAAAVPDQQAPIVDRFDPTFGAGHVTVTINYPDDAMESDLGDRAEQGFRRMGWTTSDDADGDLVAAGAGLSVRVYRAALCGPRDPGECGAEIVSSTPEAALAFRFEVHVRWAPLTVAGLLAGLAAGWTLRKRGDAPAAGGSAGASRSSGD
ncbi:hypothetical protein Q0Z83_017580 [Actinoplanes sichuanensis]|uniref:Uncharacterized protein n=1 Tax=Actinoplanes sichuanensis TaxID=512349 RepID=A0ABW4A8R7_9ACTN|nr:hypothetical protein [Actinoplanes sichuanensis]BEL03567.1 hypothetical protein Q0Z83_017580 [Actinoplanes sichuanensis]